MKYIKKFYIEGYYQIAGKGFEKIEIFDERMYTSKNYDDAKKMAMGDGLKKFMFVNFILMNEEKNAIDIL